MPAVAQVHLAVQIGSLAGVSDLTGYGLLPPLFSENIFTQQPSYFGDLDETLPTVLQVLLSCLARARFQLGMGTAQGVEGSSRAPGRQAVSAVAHSLWVMPRVSGRF